MLCDRDAKILSGHDASFLCFLVDFFQALFFSFFFCFTLSVWHQTVISKRGLQKEKRLEI